MVFQSVSRSILHNQTAPIFHIPFLCIRVPDHVRALTVQSHCSWEFPKPVLGPAQTYLRHRPQLFTRALTRRTSSYIYRQYMVECGMRLSPITALYKLPHLFFAFFRVRRNGILECIVKGEAVTAGSNPSPLGIMAM